jgi:transposase-like protein
MAARQSALKASMARWTSIRRAAAMAHSSHNSSRRVKPAWRRWMIKFSRFTQAWQADYPLISKSWTANWAHLRTIFEYPPEIRKAIYTTNAIELLNSVIRSATK